MVSTNEKNFNLDRPDGWAYYWRDIRKKERSSRSATLAETCWWFGEAFLPSTPSISHFPRPEWTRRSTRPSSRLILSPFSVSTASRNSLFQDNTLCDVFHWLSTFSLPENRYHWLVALSYDLNITENIWGYISCKVYTNSKQYRTVGAPKRTIIVVWKTVDIPYLIFSMTSCSSALSKFSSVADAFAIIINRFMMIYHCLNPQIVFQKPSIFMWCILWGE